MTEPPGGPPTNDEAPAGQARGDVERADNHTNKPRVYRRRGVPTVRHTPQDTLSQLKRRREASRRVPPLDCGCPDPWPCRCTEPPLSDHALDGWRDAAEHILQTTDQTPVLPLEALRALYRRGGADRALAEQLHELAGGQVA